MERWRSHMRWIDMTRPSQPPVYRDVTGKPNDIFVLNYLDNLFKVYKCVLESTFYSEFTAIDTISINFINPKCIIEEMLEKYFSNLVRIYIEPEFTRTFIFIFRTESCERKFIFSNRMKFNEDINIICYLHHIKLVPNLPQINFQMCETVQILTKLMRNKYGIDFDQEDINKFTVSNIALSFPSITWDMVHNNYGYYPEFCLLFPDLDLPKIIFIPSIIMVLPKLEDSPIAILVAISIKLHDIYTSTPLCSLEIIYNYILDFIYNYTLVPERLKLELCMKWNIVVKENNTYKYAPCFAANHQKAKRLISEFRSNDPKLQDILSKI